MQPLFPSTFLAFFLLFRHSRQLARRPGIAAAAQIPDTPVKGTVNGKPFVPNAVSVHITKNGMQINDAKFDTYELAIQTDGIFNEMTAHVLVKSGGRPDGHVYRVLPIDSIGGQPMAAPGTPEIQGWDLELEAAVSIPASPRRSPRCVSNSCRAKAMRFRARSISASRARRPRSWARSRRRWTGSGHSVGTQRNSATGSSSRGGDHRGHDR